MEYYYNLGGYMQYHTVQELIAVMKVIGEKGVELERILTNDSLIGNKTVIAYKLHDVVSLAKQLIDHTTGDENDER